MEKLEYKKINPISTYTCYQLGDEPEVIHIIKFGHDNSYCVVHEDAWEIRNGETELMTKEMIFEKYGLVL